MSKPNGHDTSRVMLAALKLAIRHAVLVMLALADPVASGASLRSTRMSRQEVVKTNDGTISRVAAFCCPEATAPSLRIHDTSRHFRAAIEG
jgi:hypothetical protein